MILVPSHFPPTQEVVLSGGLILKPSKRVSVGNKLQTTSGNAVVDSFQLIGANDVVSEQFKDWLLFHAFLFGEGEILTTLEYFQRDYEIEQIEQLETENYSPVDYDDVLSDAYFINGTGNLEKRSYSSLYDDFLKLSEEQKTLIKNLTILALDDQIIGSTTQRKIIDDSYWRILAGYSVIETLIGDQPATCNSGVEGNCPVCGKPHNHKPLPDNEWVKNQLEALVKNDARSTEYTKLVIEIKKKLRNPTAHGRLHPRTGVPTSRPRPGIFTYTLEESINLLNKDAAAVESLKGQIFDLAKILILNRYFDLDIFPKINVLMTETVSFGGM